MTDATFVLLSDFGYRDHYQGVIRLKLHRLCPQISCLDLNHGLRAQDVRAAAYQLMAAAGELPCPSVVLAMVERAGQGPCASLAIETRSGHLLLGADNGLFEPLLRRDPAQAIVALEPAQGANLNFRARDVLAPAAAALVGGASVEEIGQAIAPDALVRLGLAGVEQEEGALRGEIWCIDHFGNLITTIDRESFGRWVGEASDVWVEMGERRWPLREGYRVARPGEIFGYWGSEGQLELALRDGSAQRSLGCSPGEVLRLLRAGSGSG